MRHSKAILQALALTTTLLAVGCGASGSPRAASASGARSPGEGLWRSKCGACHVPVAPQSHARPALEQALGRHRARVRLTEPEWQSLVDFLAPTSVAGARASSAP